MKSIEFMEDFYNITDYPFLIIEGEVYEGFFKIEKDWVILLLKNLNQTNQSLSG